MLSRGSQWWLGIGPRARTFALCRLLGVEDLVQHCIRQGAPKWDLGGFTPDGDIRALLLHCGLSSRVAEAASWHLMRDDRLHEVHDTVLQDVEFEHLQLEACPDGVWHALATVADSDARSVRARVLLAAHMLEMKYATSSRVRIGLS